MKGYKSVGISKPKAMRYNEQGRRKDANSSWTSSEKSERIKKLSLIAAEQKKKKQSETIDFQ